MTRPAYTCEKCGGMSSSPRDCCGKPMQPARLTGDTATAPLYLRRTDAGDYVSRGEHFVLAQVPDLIEPFRFAAVSRFDGSLVAGSSRAQVAPYGNPRFAPDLAQEILLRAGPVAVDALSKNGGRL